MCTLNRAIAAIVLAFALSACTSAPSTPLGTPEASVTPPAAPALSPTPLLAGGPLVAAGTPLPGGLERITADNAGRLVHLAEWGHGLWRAAELSPDGRLLAVVADEGIAVYAVPALTPLVSFADTEVPAGPYGLTFSPNGELLAVNSEYGSSAPSAVCVLHLATAKRLYCVRGDDPAFGPDGALLVTTTDWLKDTIAIWHSRDGVKVREMTGPVAALSLDGALIAMESGTLWRVSDGTLIHDFSDASIGIASEAAFCPDGMRLAVAYHRHSGTYATRVWRLDDYTLEHQFEGGWPQFSPDGNYLVTQVDPAWQNWIMLYHLADKRQIVRFMGGSVAFSSQGTLLGVGLAEEGRGITRVLRADDGTQISEVPGGFMGFGGDQTSVVTGDETAVRTWRMADGGAVAALGGYVNLPVMALAFSPDGAWLAGRYCCSESGMWEETPYWRVCDGELVGALPGLSYYTPAFSPDSALLATSEGVYNIASGDRLYRLDHALARVFSPDGSLLAAPGYDEAVPVLQMSDGHVAVTLQRGDFVIPAFSPDGTLIALNGGLYRVSDGALASSVSGQDPEFSPDGTLLATDTGLYRVADGSRVRALSSRRPHFSPDGTLLLSWSGSAGELRRVDDGGLVCTMANDAMDAELSFSPDGSLVMVVKFLGNALPIGQGTLVELRRTRDCSFVAALNAVAASFSPDGMLLATTTSTRVDVWGIAP